MVANSEIPYDNDSVALIVVDMQEGFRASADKVTSDVEELVKNCHKRNVPIFWTQHGHRKLDDDVLVSWWGVDDSVKYGTEEWKIVKELRPYVQRSPGSLGKLDFTITSKSQYDAFHGTELDSLLRAIGVKTIIVSGVMTNLCCESTARGGFMHNYNVVFLDDGCATATEEMHNATLLNLKYGFAKIAKIEDLWKWL